jgi:hypothetical protein
MWNTRKARSYVDNNQIVSVSLLHFDQASYHHVFSLLQTELLNYNLNNSVSVIRLLQFKVKIVTKCVLINISLFVLKGV